MDHIEGCQRGKVSILLATNTVETQNDGEKENKK